MLLPLLRRSANGRRPIATLFRAPRSATASAEVISPCWASTRGRAPCAMAILGPSKVRLNRLYRRLAAQYAGQHGAVAAGAAPTGGYHRWLSSNFPSRVLGKAELEPRSLSASGIRVDAGSIGAPHRLKRGQRKNPGQCVHPDNDREHGKPASRLVVEKRGERPPEN